VYRLGPQDDLQPVTNTTVRIEATDDSDVTTSTGGFRLYLPDLFKPGQTVTLQVDLEGYRILIPHGGQVRIPAIPLTDPVQIRLDKKGSHRFMNHEAFALLMENVANKAKEQVQTGDEPQEVDLSRYLKDWAVKYGFGLAEVRAELDKWAAEIEATSVNFYELGLAAFYKKNFGEAATNFTRSAQAHDRQLAKVREQLAKGREQEAELREKVIRDYLLAGNAHYNDYHFQDAAQSYRKALHMAPRDQLPQQWAATQNNLGNTLQAQGIRTSGEESRALLAQAVEAYRLTLEVYTREALPQDWAMTQNNLGLALQNQGIRTSGEDSRVLLAQAVEAYRLALEVYTREALPQQWATTQNNLGIALKALGEHDHNAELLIEAKQAVEAAYTFYMNSGYQHYSDYFEKELSEISQMIEKLR